MKRYWAKMWGKEAQGRDMRLEPMAFSLRELIDFRRGSTVFSICWGTEDGVLFHYSSGSFNRKYQPGASKVPATQA